MALVLSPWFGQGCTRRSAPRFGFGSPSLFTDLVIVRVPVQRQSCAPVDRPAAASFSSNARVVQWTETPDAHVFKLRLPGLKKEDLHIQVEDGRILYISYSDQLKEEGAQEGAAKEVGRRSSSCYHFPTGGADFQAKVQATGDCRCGADQSRSEQRDVDDDCFKPKTKSPEALKIEVGDGAATPLTSTA